MILVLVGCCLTVPFFLWRPLASYKSPACLKYKGWLVDDLLSTKLVLIAALGHNRTCMKIGMKKTTLARLPFRLGLGRIMDATWLSSWLLVPFVFLFILGCIWHYVWFGSFYCIFLYSWLVGVIVVIKVLLWTLSWLVVMIATCDWFHLRCVHVLACTKRLVVHLLKSILYGFWREGLDPYSTGFGASQWSCSCGL
jgi:hypothetical protein